MSAFGRKGEDRTIRTRLNLATAPLLNHRPFYMLAAAIGFPALVLFIGLGFKVAHDRAASSARRLEVARLEQEIAGYRRQRSELEQFFAAPSVRLATQRAAFLNSIIDQRSFPWTDLFVDLEKRLPAGVHILMLAPSLAGNHVEVKMRVGALSDKSKIEFLKALESAPEFSRLELLSESRSGRAEERDVVQLDLTADYHPVAGPAGRKPEQSGGAE